MPTFRSLKKIVIPTRKGRFLNFLEQILTPTPSREIATTSIAKFFNPRPKRSGVMGDVNAWLNPRVRRYGFWKVFSQFVQPEPPRSGFMKVVTAFLDAPVYRLQQGGRDITRPREREANFLQKFISGINEFLNAYTHFADLFSGKENIFEVPSDAFKTALEKLVFGSRLRIERLTERLLEGRLTPREFQERMILEVRRINMAAALLGVRGLGNLTPSGIAAIISQTGSEILRLQRFLADSFGPNLTRDLSSANITEGQFTAWSKGFASAGRAASTVAQSALMDSLYGAAIDIGGRLYMRRVLDPGAQHCGDCEEWASIGWVEVSSGILPPPGTECICAWRCRCKLEFALVSSISNLPEEIAY